MSEKNPLATDDYSGFKDFNKIVHEPIRLGILTLLFTIKQADFSFLKKELNISDGNIFTHLRKLEETKYISVIKKFVNRKPKTIYEITEKGKKAFKAHIKKLEDIFSKI